MGRRINWANVEKNTKVIEKKVKVLKSAGDYLKDKPVVGCFKDNISKSIVEIKNCKSSSLRRYVKLIDKYYYLITSIEDRDYLIRKKIEIENELNSREDAIIKKE